MKILFILFCRTRDYNPPDVPGYFDKVVWPHYIQAYSEIMERDDISELNRNIFKV